MDQPRPTLTVLTGGFIAGAFDITFACVFWAIKAGLAPTRIFQSVAAGLLGTASFQGGTATAVLGLALHFFIAITMATVYYLVSLRLPALRRSPWLWGPLYGVALYVIMNFVVVPLSAAGSGSKDPLWVALSVLVNLFLIGTPIALAARRARPV